MADQSNSSTNREARVHLDFLDGMRGLAALYVAISHAAQTNMYLMATSFPDLQGAKYQKILNALNFTFMRFGNYAVVWFIVLSGFCLTIPIIRKKSLNFKEFALRRARRILPPYYATLAFSLLLIFLIPGMNVKQDQYWDMQLPVTPGAIISHLFLIHNVLPSWILKINAPLWTVALEWQIYFVFALVLYPIWKKWNLTCAVAVAALLGLAPYFLTPKDAFFNISSPWMVIAFSVGMMAAVICFDETSRWKNVPWMKIVYATVVPIALLLLIQRRNFKEHALLKWLVLDYNGLKYLAEIVAAVWFGILIVGCTLYLMSHRGEKPFFLLRLFSHPLSIKLGVFSYSLYLIHEPILGAVNVFALRYIHSGPLASLTVVTLGPLLSVVIAYVFHLLVERHCLNVRPAKPAQGSASS